MMKRMFEMICQKMRKGSIAIRFRTTAMLLAVIVVFSTSYALILPAMTISEDEAYDEPGMYFEEEYTDDDLYEEMYDETPDGGAYEYEEESYEYDEYASDDSWEYVSDDGEEYVSDDGEYVSDDGYEYEEEYTEDDMTAEAALTESEAESIAEPVLTEPEMEEEVIETEIEEADEEVIETEIEEVEEEIIETEIEEVEEEVIETEIEEIEEEVIEAEIEETESIAEPVLTESDAESIAEPVLTESDAESIVEPVLTESDAESIAEPVLTESDAESIAEPVLTESDAESIAEPVLTESDAESIAEPVLEESEVFAAGSRYIRVEGADYTIRVEYEESARIPANAVFKAVSLEGQTDYDGYRDQAIGAIEAEKENENENEIISMIGMFDLTIYNGEGQVIQPAAPIRVTVNFGDVITEETSVQAVHFPGSGEQPTESAASFAEEVLAEETAAEEVPAEEMTDEAVTDGTETIEVLSTECAEGSVSFSAESFSIYVIVETISGAADLDGRTVAMINPNTRNALQAKERSDSKLEAAKVEFDRDYVKTNEELSFWTFRSDGNGGYYIQDENGRYLTIDEYSYWFVTNYSLSLTNTPTALHVTSGTDGMIRVTNGNKLAVTNSNGSTSGGFGVNNGKVSNNDYFALYEMEEVVFNPPYTGEKISAQSLLDAQRVIIYKSVYDENLNAYTDYVIDGYGNAVKAFDKGDQVTLRSAVSPVWVLTMHRDETTKELNGYYDFYNEETGMYLSPQSDGTLVSSVRPGVTLNGRRDGQYVSTIEKWDEDAWAWYGFQMGTDEKGDIELQSGSGDQSQTFSFAAYISEMTPELHEVETVDSKANGITINMYNFSSWNEIDGVMGKTSYTNGNTSPDRVKRLLGKDGFPVFTSTGKSASNLFGGSNFEGEANHLFLDSIYESTGYYEYNAFNNFAHFNGSDFTVYTEIGTPSNSDQFYFERGNFFPFNSIDVNRPATNTNLYDGDGKPLDILDPTNGGKLYLTNSPDYYFGMTVSANFLMPKDGHEKGTPVIYEFNGDDDLWVYIDGVLVLDIGGVHDAISGHINFATGEVVVNSGNAVHTTIKEMFRKAGVFPDGTAYSVNREAEYFRGDTFVDYGSHTMNMFYMEHGAGASNLEVRFNLPVIEEGKFTVEKKLAETTQQKYANVSFAYQAFLENGTPLTAAVYEKTTNPVQFYGTDANPVVIDGRSYTNVFYLKPGQAATFNVPDENVKYYVQEIGISSDYYDNIEVNDVQIDGESQDASEGIYRSTTASVRNRARVTYTNHCSEKNLNELLITKELSEGSYDDGSGFEFRVLLENADGQLAPYSTAPYSVVKIGDDGEYEYFRYENGKLVSNGRTPVKASVSGNNGTINGIQAGYTVLIDNLLADTEFYVEEIRLPKAYELEKKTVAAESCDAGSMSGTGWAGDAVTADGKIRLDTTASVVFTNKRTLPAPIEVNILKVTAGTDRPLADAVFALYGEDYYTEDASGEKAVNPEAKAIRENLTSGEDGIISLGRFNSGVYYLVETEAPAGYMLLAEPVTIRVNCGTAAVITEDGKDYPLYVTYLQNDNSASFNQSGIHVTSRTEEGETVYTYTLTVANNPGVELPNTGGVGTGMFTLFGCILMMGGALLLLVRYRAKMAF